MWIRWWSNVSIWIDTINIKSTSQNWLWNFPNGLWNFSFLIVSLFYVSFLWPHFSFLFGHFLRLGRRKWATPPWRYFRLHQPKRIRHTSHEVSETQMETSTLERDYTWDGVVRTEKGVNEESPKESLIHPNRSCLDVSFPSGSIEILTK